MIKDLMAGHLGEGEFVMFLQSKHDAKTGKISGAEALSRYKRADGTILTPDKFIDLLEEEKLIHELDFAMLDLACGFLSVIEEKGIHVPISVNFSKVTLELDNFLETFYNIIKPYNIPPQFIEIEITELHRFSSVTQMGDVIRNLRSHGYLVSIDDYGKNSSAFSIIRHVDVDVLKIDREIITESVEQDKTKLIFKSVVDLSKKLNISVVAEGVETERQLEITREIGCDSIQGWYFSKAVPSEEFLQTLLTA